MNRIPIDQPESFMRWLVSNEDDHDSCLWCEHICNIIGSPSTYICDIHKIYFDQNGRDETVYDKMTCANHVKSEDEEMKMYEGVEENKATPLTMTFASSFS